MDWTALKNKTAQFLRQYKYAALVLVLGLVLMMLPEGREEITKTEADVAAPTGSVSEELEAILAQIDGVGKVSVMLTESAGGETVYQTDEDSDSDSDRQSIRLETVILTDAERAEYGLVRQVNPPVWLGAIVVCQGAERPAVRLSVVEAVANVTGISTDRITVLKMK